MMQMNPAAAGRMLHYAPEIQAPTVRRTSMLARQQMPSRSKGGSIPTTTGAARLERKMNIVHVITGLNDGGAESTLFQLVTRERANRHVVVSLMDCGKYGSLLEKEAIRLHTLDLQRGRISLVSMLRLWRILRDEKPQAVQTWMYHADLIGGTTARLAGIRHVYWGVHHADLDKASTPLLTRLVARLNALLSHVVPSKIICCAERARLVHRRLGYRAQKLVVVPNGYDTTRFAPSRDDRTKLREHWGLGEDIPVLGMVGRFHPDKDHENLLQALSKLKQKDDHFACLLVGPGINTANEELMSWIDRWDVKSHVRLLDRQSDIPAIMNAIDIHVLSSRSEAFPNVIAEAMACGTPCVTTAVGDAPMIVGSTGWIAPVSDASALASTIKLSLEAREDVAEWNMRRAACRQRIIDYFDYDRMVESYLRIWKSSSNCKSSGL